MSTNTTTITNEGTSSACKTACKTPVANVITETKVEQNVTINMYIFTMWLLNLTVCSCIIKLLTYNERSNSYEESNIH